MSHGKAVWVVVFGLLLANCEKVDLESENNESGDNAYEQIVPTSYGHGTQESPLIPEQIIKGENLPTNSYWVIGYVVGSTYRFMSNAAFVAETENTSNILLSSDMNCENTENCIPIELSTSSIQKTLCLHHNSHLFRQCVMVLGQYGRYFSRNGLRNVQAGYWLPDFNLSTIKTAPTEWQERNIMY